MSLRFKVGDLAVYAVPLPVEALPHVGTVVEIVEVGPFGDGDWCAALKRTVRGRGHHYCCRHPADTGLVFDWQLRPISGLSEPLALTRESREEMPA